MASLAGLISVLIVLTQDLRPGLANDAAPRLIRACATDGGREWELHCGMK